MGEPVGARFECSQRCKLSCLPAIILLIKKHNFLTERSAVKIDISLYFPST